MHVRALLCIALLLCIEQVSAQTPYPDKGARPPVYVGVKTTGVLTWNGLAMSDTVFEERLAQATKGCPDLRVHVALNKHAGYNRTIYRRVSHLMAILQRYDVDIGLIGNEAN